MTSRTALDAYELATSAKQDIESHEEKCEIRYSAIHDTIKEIKSWVKAGVYGVAGIAVTLGGAMAHEIYNNLQHPQPAAQVSVK